jgi:archaellum component FlaC
MSTVAPSLFPTSICSRRLEHWEIEAITKGINQSIDPKPSDAAQIASLCQGYYSGVEQCLVKARSMGYPVISFNVLLEMLKEDLRRGTGMFTTKGPVVEPPRKTLDTETRLKSLESTIEQVSQKLSKLTEDVSGISQSSGSCNTQTTREVHEELGALLRSLREQTLKSSDNGGVTSAVDIKSPTQAASPTKQQSDALQALLDPVTERVAVLENVLNSVQDKINTFQPNLCNNHCKSQIQKLEEKFNELQRSLELLALADTAGSTDGMLTPTSVSLGFGNRELN